MEVNHLSARVYARVRASGGVDGSGSSADARNRVLQHALYGGAVTIGLTLQTVVVRAIVLNTARYIHHHLFMYSTMQSKTRARPGKFAPFRRHPLCDGPV